MKNCFPIARSLLLIAICTITPPPNCHACGLYGCLDLDSLKRELSDPPGNLADIATRYRSFGQPGVDQLVAFRGRLEQNDQELLPALDTLIDKVAAQRHASHSRLYWYTDLETAQRVAAASGKPILSLRLLGNLDEELSCANSRFFRTTLYANEEISLVLRNQFVLHWQSVRPVPKVTVDFGDGRKLQRTVTGNSVHYVVTADGVLLDGLPGLYAPEPFQAWLTRCLKLHGQLTQAASPAQQKDLLVSYHTGRKQHILAQWQNDLEVAGELPRRKSRKAVRDLSAEALLAKTSETMWELFAAQDSVEEGALDQASIRLIRSENPAAGDAQRLSFSKSLAEDPVFRLVRNLERTIRIDTVRNEYLLHRQLHDWLAAAATGTGARDAVILAQELNDLNTRVYATLFRSPLHDPWLGLLPADTYNALDNGGRTGGAWADVGGSVGRTALARE